MIKNLRWYMAGLLMLATTINYLDRQTLSVAAPVLKKEFNLSNEQYGLVTSAFLVAYGVMHPISGRIIDWLGTRAGLAISVIWWSLANIAHAFVGGFRSLQVMRFLLGVGEAGNFPGAIKSISEWFPAKERSVATGIMNLGAGMGAVIAPPLVGWLVWAYGWQAAFVVTGASGAIWIVAWLLLYRHPDEHPRLSPEELAYIKAGQESHASPDIHCPQCSYNLRGLPTLRCPECGTDSEHRRAQLAVAEPPAQGLWKDVLSRGEIWALMAARFISDPGWFFYLLWLPNYLSSERGFSLTTIAMSAWIPYLGADFGSLIGGFVSASFIKRGMSVVTARKVAMCCFAALMPVAIPAVRAESPIAALFFITIATTAHQAWAASLLTLPADLFPRRSVASAYGFTGMCGMLGSALFSPLVGYMVDHFHSYVPVFTIVGFLHPVAAIIVVLFVRSKTSRPKELATA